MKILITGATGLIGNTVFKYLSKKNYSVIGTINDKEDLRYFNLKEIKNLYIINDIFEFDNILNLFINVKPDVVINCIGITKHRKNNKIDDFYKYNSVLPHKISYLCSLNNSRFIQISTDCVFTGNRGYYNEMDIPDSTDNYGISKLLGEINGENMLTIRTSTIGMEIKNSYGLLSWFLNQKIECNGYVNAYFSGLPTIIFAEIIDNYILKNCKLSGLYHIGSEKISKYELLKIISRIYNKKIEIIPSNSITIDRSLDSSKFMSETGFVPLNWDKMVSHMFEMEYLYARE